MDINRDAILIKVEGLPALDLQSRADAIVGILEIVYSDLSAETLHWYYSFGDCTVDRDDPCKECEKCLWKQPIEKSLAEIDPEYIQGLLKDRGLLDSSSGELQGGLVENFKAMVVNTGGDK